MSAAILIETQSHLPTWRRTHAGMTWQDMPGPDNETRKLNFCLFVWGRYDPGKEAVTEADSGLDKEDLHIAKRTADGLVLKAGKKSLFGKIRHLRPKAPKPEKVDDAPQREERQAELLQRYNAARSQRGFFKRFRDLDITAHSTLCRLRGKSRGIQGPLRTVSLERIERAFAKLNEEGWVV